MFLGIREHHMTFCSMRFDVFICRVRVSSCKEIIGLRLKRESNNSQVGSMFNGTFYYSVDHWYLVCFMSCLFSGFTTPSLSPFSCPPLTEPPGGVCASRKSTCFGDESCSSIAKCCFDGCRFSCVGRDGELTGDFQHLKCSIKTALLALPTW